MKTKLYEYQRKALNTCKLREYFHYDMDMGTGKTLVTLAEVEHLFSKGKIDCAIIVAPKGMYHQWEEEFYKHCDEALCESVLTYTWGQASGARDLSAIEEVFSKDSNLGRFIVLNTEALSTKRGKDFLLCLTKRFKDIYISVDEATDIKHHQTARTRALLDTQHLFKYRRILSGSLGSNSPLEVYSPYRFLHRTIFPGNWYAFRARYAKLEDQFMGGGRSIKKIVGYRNIEDLATRCSRHSFMLRKDESIDLPDKVFMQRNVLLSKEQMALYNQMREEFIIQLDETKLVSASIVLTQIMVLRQILCGFLVTKDVETMEKEVHPIQPNPRDSALLEVIQEIRNPEKVVIWAPFQQAIRGLHSLLEETYGKGSTITFYGGNNSRTEDLQRWKKSPEVRFCLGTLSAGGRGLNMIEASNMVYYSPDWDLDKLKQSQDRIHRIGQENRCVYTTLVAKGTVDERIMKIVHDKRQTLGIFNGTQRAAQEYRELLKG